MRATIGIVAMAALLFTAQASAQCSGSGTVIDPNGCGIYDFNGCCDGEELYWCENNVTCYMDCATLGPFCGWSDLGLFYDCDTPGATAPGNNPPMDCPNAGPPDNDNDGYDANSDCDDNNAWVNPGAFENCADGIDNDCDGLIDNADPDCAGQGDDDTAADDDASDDDAASDDDTANDDDAASDDDDGDDDDGDDDDDAETQGGVNPGLGLACNCRVSGAPPAAAGPAVLLMMLLLLGRRIR